MASFRAGIIARSAMADTTPPNTLRALPGAFVFTGEEMTTVTAFALPAGVGAFVVSDPGATALTPPVGAGATLAFQSRAAMSAGGPAITYSGLTVAGGATRTVAVIMGVGNATVSGIASVTVGGVAFTHVSGSFAGANSSEIFADVWESNSALSAGTHSAVVTHNATTDYWSAIGLFNLTTTTPTAAAAVGYKSSGGETSSSIGPITVPTNGVAVFGGFAYFGSVVTITTGNLAIDDNTTNGSIPWYFGHLTATGSQTVTGTHSNDQLGMTMAAWGP